MIFVPSLHYLVRGMLAAGFAWRSVSATVNRGFFILPLSSSSFGVPSVVTRLIRHGKRERLEFCLLVLKREDAPSRLERSSILVFAVTAPARLEW